MTGADADAARFFQALGDPTRLSLLRELREGERNVSELVESLGCPQPKVSRHLKVLKEAGLVRDERDGRHVTYALTPSRRWPEAGRAWMERLEAGLPLASRRPAAGRGPAAAALAARPDPAAARVLPPGPVPPAARRTDKGLEAHLL